MHQHPRPSPRVASPTNSAQTNPSRTSNTKEQDPDRSGSVYDFIGNNERTASDRAEGNTSEDRVAGQNKDGKLNQIIQVGVMSSKDALKSDYLCAATVLQGCSHDSLSQSGAPSELQARIRPCTGQ